MRLLSEDFPMGQPGGPLFPKAYPEVEPDALSNVELFLQGQPFDIYAKLRAEAQTLLEQIKVQRADSDRIAGEMLANAKAEAKRLEAEAEVKLAEQIKRRGELAERKIATAEAQAAADVKAAAADLAAQMAEQLLSARIAVAKTDPLVDAAIGQMASKLQ